MSTALKAGSATALTAALLAFAFVGTGPFVPTGCTGIQVVDKTTGQLRPPTTQEVTTAIQGAGNAGAIVATATGHPEIGAIIDIACRGLALIVAWLLSSPFKPRVPAVVGDG